MLKSGLAAVAAVVVALPAYAASTPVDLSSWVAEGSPGGYNWVLQPGNNSVLQTVNGNPTVFYSAGNAQGKSLSGTIRVNANGGDDDYVGFVLGFGAGDLAAASTDFLVIDWKKGTQGSFGCNAFAGLSISRATAGLGNNAGGWCHQGDGVTELQRGATLGSTGWNHNQEYTFDLVFTASNVQVFVDGVKQIDLNGTFADGAFGFYNYSQASVLYAGIQEAVLPPDPTPGVPEPATWAMLIMGFGIVGAAARRRRHGASLSN